MALEIISAEQTEGRRINEDWGSLRWLASRPLGNVHDVTLGRVVIKAGQANPRHRHNRCEEVLYLLVGTLEHTVGDDSVTLHAGDTLAIPAGIFHNATCTSAEDADMMVVYSDGERDFELESGAAAT